MFALETYNELVELSEYCTLSELQIQGLNIHAPDKYGVYPLSPICKALKIDFAKQLIQAGADVNLRDSCGFTPLLSTIECCHVNPSIARELIALLLTSDADIEGRGERDKTPFLKSCTRGEISITQFLVESGCNIHATARELSGPMGAFEFSELPDNSIEFKEYIRSLYRS